MIEWNDKFNSLYSWYEIHDLIAETEWDLPDCELLDLYIKDNVSKIKNNIWTNRVHKTLKKVAQTYNYKIEIYDYHDKNEKNKVILYKNSNRIKTNKNKFWVICNEKFDFIKKYSSLEDAQDNFFLKMQKENDKIFLLESKNYT